MAAALGLAIATRLYNPAWSDDLSLWERGARIDPASATVFSQLGSAYERAGRDVEARVALTRALEIKPDLTTANIGMGIVAIRQRRFDEAERYLKGVIDVYPNYDVARENLAVAYQERGKLAEATTLLEEGRRLMPYKGASYTVNIAMLYKQAGFGVEAQAELESLIPQLPSATDAEVIKAWWYLGEIYREQQKAGAAINAYEKYITATAD
jgi:Flp pilus assembly protein TadD